MSFRIKGRGAVSNDTGRYESLRREAIPEDRWITDNGRIESAPDSKEPEFDPNAVFDELDESGPRTIVLRDDSKSVITYNKSPDIPFDRSINPYKGCEHGCSYCYARPTHAYLGLSPGLDFETQLYAKYDAPQLLEQELAKKNYKSAPIALGSNTDAYQPIERKLEISKNILEILADFRHPVTIITKSALISRDRGLLADMAKHQLAHVSISITTLDASLARDLEPRAASPKRRLELVEELSQAGIPVSVMIAPLIPGLNDHELEKIMYAASSRGAVSANYVLLRLPRETAEIFHQWLQKFRPQKAKRVETLIKDVRGGGSSQASFGQRMRGTGAYAEVIAKRFNLAAKRYGFSDSNYKLKKTAFKVPNRCLSQLRLF